MTTFSFSGLVNQPAVLRGPRPAVAVVALFVHRPIIISRKLVVLPGVEKLLFSPTLIA